jgi:DNA-directed RNA polymerase alpha subunit
MEDNQLEFTEVSITQMNSAIMAFCGIITNQYLDQLDGREALICKHLLEGRSMKSASNTFGLTEERVRQIFYKCIKKIKNAYEAQIDETNRIKAENEELKHKVYVQGKELESTQSKVNVDSLMTQEKNLCRKAAKLLDTSVKDLPFSIRTLNILIANNIMTFKEIPQYTPEQFAFMRNCGRKSIFEIVNYLSKFGLRAGMPYDEVIEKLSTLTDKDIDLPSKSLGVLAPIKKPAIKLQEPSKEERAEQLSQMTLSAFCAEMGRSKGTKKKWGKMVNNLLLANNIDTLDKFLAMRRSDFEALKGVGPATIKHVKMAFDHFGIEWK